jgi:toxin ParE1/3/4
MAVKWLVGALKNLAAIAEHIAEDKPERASTFVREIREKTNRLQDFPSIGRAGRVAGTRELVVHNNYIIIYRMKSANVEILRIHHAAQKQPNKMG